MRIQPKDLNGLQSAYRKVLTESQETGHNGGMNDTYSYAQLMYNRSGEDESYAEMDCAGKSIKQVVMGLCAQVDFCDGLSFADFEKQFENQHGVVYSAEGVGVFIVKNKEAFQEFYNEWHKSQGSDEEGDTTHTAPELPEHWKGKKMLTPDDLEEYVRLISKGTKAAATK